MKTVVESIYSKTKSVMDTWCENDIYAISFLVYANEAHEYKGYTNVSSFAVSYNTEADCEGAAAYSEERWNYAFWRQDETPIIDYNQPDAVTDQLFTWYKDNGITDLGKDDDDSYDDEGNYIGKGPVGHYELLTIVSTIAKRLQQEGYTEHRFGRKLPIIIHGLEYAWYDIEATKQANIHGEATVFLQAITEWGIL